jgi:hypothetical protein
MSTTDLDFYCGFDLFGDQTDVTREWTLSAGSVSLTTGRFGTGKALKLGSINGSGVSRSVPATATKAVGWAEQFPPFINASSRFMALREGTTEHLSVGWDASGRLVVRRGNNVGTVLATDTTNVYSAATYYHFGLRATIHDSTGSFELYVNEALVLSASGIDTRNGGTSGVCDNIYFVTTGTNAVPEIDDVYVHDCSGTYTDVLGDVIAEGQVPDGDGDVNDSTIGGGSAPANRYQAVDDATVNEDDDYVSMDTSGQRQYFTYPALNGTPQNIYGLKQTAVARKDDASGIQYQLSIRDAGNVNYDGASIAAGASYEFKAEYWSENPGTAAPFTPSEINSTQGGAEIV